MPENKFEQEVRSALEGYKLQPSPSVWDAVEKQLPKKEKRRRWLILFFLLAAVGAGGYFIFIAGNGRPVQQQAGTVQKNNSGEQQTSEEKNGGQAPLTQAGTIHAADSGQADNATTTTPLSRQDPQQVADHVAPLVNHHAANKNNKAGNPVYTITGKPGTQKNSAVANQPLPMEKTGEALLLGANKESAGDTTRKSTGSSEDASKNQGPDSLEQQPGDLTTITKPPMPGVVSDSAEKKTTVKNKKNTNTPNRKWHFGIAAEYGRSDITERLFDINSEKVYSSTLVAGIPATAVQNNSSLNKKLEPGTHLSIGIALEKQLAKRTTLVTGLSYTYNSNYLQTGKLYNTPRVFYFNATQVAPERINQFYGAATSSSNIHRYKNNFTYIRLPLLLQQQMNRSTRFPLYIQAGGSLGYLLHSNVLVYDNYNQVYYNSSKFIKPLQVQTEVGIATGFNLGKKLFLHAGPMLQYQLTNTFSKPEYGKMHLLNVGLQARIMLK